jgi:hypothetical protein
MNQTLELSGAGTVKMGTSLIGGGEIKGTASGETLENNGNTISGSGQIGDGTTSDLTLDNSSGTIEALNSTLTIYTGNFITNSAFGTLAAASSGTLQFDDATLDNFGNIQINGGKLAVGLANEAFTLNDGGTVTLVNGTIEALGTANTDTFQSDNTISGTGAFGGGLSETFVLTNSNGGVIEASGGTLILETGNSITNAAGAILEAASGATLQINDAVSNAGTIEDFGTVALNGDTVTDTGSGGITLESNAAILDLEGATVSAGTITNSGTINVTGTATIEGSATITGGALSIASGAKLDIEATNATDTLNAVSVSNLGTIAVDGSASTVT